jgi:hypothetical protein
MAGFPYALWVITVLLGVVIFVPLFVIAVIRLPSARLAFIVSASFSLGAMVGFFLSFIAVSWLIPPHLNESWYGIPLFVFVSAGAIGGAALALGLARKHMR